MSMLIYGLITGILFGFLLQKGRVLRYDKQLGALRLTDLTIFKFMGTSVIVAMIGVYLLVDLGLVKLDLLPTVLGKNVLGGLLFGVGWAVLGYCPGTSAGAAGEGRWDALFGALGMVAAAGHHRGQDNDALRAVFAVLQKTAGYDAGVNRRMGRFRKSDASGCARREPLVRHRLVCDTLSGDIQVGGEKRAVAYQRENPAGFAGSGAQQKCKGSPYWHCSALI